MSNWGDRYGHVDSFIRYCRGLGVETERDELEYYEKTGAMLPVARVVYPNEYVIKRDQSFWSGDTDWDGADQWPDLGRLSERFGPFPFGYDGLTDKELIHCFDREMDAGDNPYLSRPDLADFRPWSDYRVPVQDRQGDNILRPTVEHYYSHWQVHQLYWIQESPDLYKNATLIECIPEDDPARRFLPRAPKVERLIDFDSKRHSFDAVSFWITVYSRERNRTFASIPKSNGFQRLDHVQAATYKTRLTVLAGEVTQRFQLTQEDLYRFLRQLMELVREYEQKERYRLVEALKRDIWAWERLLMLSTGKTRDEVAEELGKGSIHDKRSFRHLDILTKERDYALEFLNHVSEDCANDLQQLGHTQWSFEESDVVDLLSYCEQEGLGLFITAMSGMVAISDEEYRRNFRRVQMYSNLKNVLNSYEYLLKGIWQATGLTTGSETLTRLVNEIMQRESWHSLFNLKKHHPQTQKYLLSAGNTQDFLANMTTLMTDKQLNGSQQGYWAQKFLVLCLARNMTVHTYPSEDSYYGDLFGPMLDSAIIATFYTWLFARTKRLV